jgi:hypothetical protein
MHAQILHRLQPRPATAVAVVALIFATTSVAIAKPDGAAVDKDEVSVASATGGLTTTTVGEEETIPLTGDFTFTQRVGEAVLLTATAEITRSATADCDLHVVVTSGRPEEVGLEMVDLWERGFHGGQSDSESLPAPAVDTVRTLRSFAQVLSAGEVGCDAAGDGETFTVSLRVSIVTFRN